MSIKSKVDKYTATAGTNAEKFAIPTVLDNIETRRPNFRWIHLPANNIAWLEALLTKYFLEANSRDITGLKSILRLLGRMQYRGAEVHSRFMRPSCKRVLVGPKQPAEVASVTSRKPSHTNRGDVKSAGHPSPKPPAPVAQQPQSQEKDMMVLFMPYLHWETDSNRRSLAESIKAPPTITHSMEESHMS